MVAAIAFHGLFVLLGAASGFSLYSPQTDAKPVAGLAEGAIIIQGISAVFSLWFGGWVAGRFTPISQRRNGWLHGFTVWGACMILGAAALTSALGWLAGDLGKLVSGGISLVGKPAAAAVSESADLVKEAGKRTSDVLASFTEESLGRIPAGSSPATNVRAKRQVSMAVAQLFDPSLQNNRDENRSALIKVLVAQGMSEADATAMVTDWAQAYDQLTTELKTAQDQAAARARAVADEAARDLAILSMCAFAALTLGGIAASIGGQHGAKSATKRDQSIIPA